MKQRLYLIYILFLAIVQIGFTQQVNKTISLQWKNNAEISINNEKLITVPLLKKETFDDFFLPIYNQRWKVVQNSQIKNYTITNIVFKNLSKSQYPSTSHSSFPTKIRSSLVIKNERDIAYAVFSITPLLYNKGLLKKIISFDIEYNITPKAPKKNLSSVHDSPFATGLWFKFAVSSSGVYKINKAFLQSLGIDPNNLNPKNIKLYGNGGAMLNELNGDFRYDDIQENAIFVSGENDNHFDDNDFILFYAQGPNVWKHNINTEIATHQKNIYTNRAYYFIQLNAGLGKRISSQAIIPGSSTETITTFNAFSVHENDLFNIDNFGQEFYGEDFSINNNQSFNFNFPDLDTSKNINVKLKAVSTSTSNSLFSLSTNNQSFLNMTLFGIGTSTILIGRTSTQSATIPATSDTIQIDVNYDNSGNPSANGFLDYIAINATRKLIVGGSQFSFRNYDVAKNTNNAIVTYQIQNASNIFQVWNITDITNPSLISNESTGTNFSFKAINGSLQEYVAINPNNLYTPEVLRSSTVLNQNLHAIKDIDYLIVTQNELLNEARRLANYHQANSNLTTLVLTEQQIYNEFSSGKKDATAIRDFVHHLYTNATTPSKRIKYLLMFGDTSFDFKNIEGGNRDTNVIAFQSVNSLNLATSYVTDDFFGMMDDNEGDLSSHNGIGDLIDVAVGRMPVKNSNEAIVAVNKTLQYYHKSSLGDWRNQISLVADDVDKYPPENGNDFVLVQKVEQVADLISLNKPVYNLKKIYADAFVQEISAGGESYPQATIAINEAVERGSLILDYFGHGGENGWSSERLLDVPQILNWFNNKNSPLFITITCEFSRYDNPTRNTAGEWVFSNANGGSISMITTAREVYISFGGTFNLDLMEDLLEYNSNDNYSIAQSLIKSKNKNSGQTQRLFIQFFGDPAMKLARPKPNVLITKMNNIDVSQQLDTIKALSHVYFEGIVTDQNSALLPNFNGELSVTVYDKSVDKTTLNNDNHFQSNGDPTVITFDSRESKIFNGKASVENGIWQFDFIAPRDIRIAYGSSKLSFYAENQIIDKNGYNTDVIIGGINNDAPEDNIGPTIKLYMNDESFIDGGNTNESPLFLAVLEDDSGINTSLTAVDHDIVAILDGDQSNPIIMNDYYETDLNNFKKGKVKFPFRNLSVGLHTITFKCWDTYNNPSEATLNFIVVSDSDLVLDNVLNYPNPFINYTEFWFNHNKPNEMLEAQVQIFTVSGKIIKTLNEVIVTNGTHSRSLNWDGLDDYGNKIGKGVYIYKLSVQVVSNGLKSEKIEKLVILQ